VPDGDSYDRHPASALPKRRTTRISAFGRQSRLCDEDLSVISAMMDAAPVAIRDPQSKIENLKGA